MFCDKASIRAIAGKGGNGCSSFRREKYVPHGGPDGGDGGRGGDITFKAVDNQRTLTDFNRLKRFKANDGVSGSKKNCHGADGEDLILDVPCGTMIMNENDELIADLNKVGDCCTVVKGGRGGKGNASFVSSVRQAPDFAEIGEPGQEIIINMELQLVADVGIIGFPSVGKSTLISKISAAKPKIADYPFTTLIPNLGVVDMSVFGADGSFVVADIPGIIEGAHEGKGLGHEFLRHVSRTSILLHVLDVNRDDFIEEFEKLNKELALFDENLSKKKQIIVFNKVDCFDDEMLEFLEEEFRLKHDVGDIFKISAVTGLGTKELAFELFEIVKKDLRSDVEEVEETEESVVIRPHLDIDERRFTVEKLDDIKEEDVVRAVYEVKGKRILQIAIMSDFSNEEAIARIYDVLYKMGIEKELRKRGAKLGDYVLLGEHKVKFRG